MFGVRVWTRHRTGEETDLVIPFDAAGWINYGNGLLAYLLYSTPRDPETEDAEWVPTHTSYDSFVEELRLWNGVERHGPVLIEPERVDPGLYPYV